LFFGTYFSNNHYLCPPITTILHRTTSLTTAMKKRNIYSALPTAACTLAGCCAVATLAARTKTATQRPNILLILCDDLGYGDVGCYGQQKILTPNIDRLAREGMRFTNYYSGSPVSAPARCTLLTGMHTGHSDIRGNDERPGRGDIWNFKQIDADSTLEGQRALLPATRTLADMLKSCGYRTGLVGKWGLGAPTSGSMPTERGFDHFYGYLCQRQAHTYFPSHLWNDDQRTWLPNRVINPHREGLDQGADPNNLESYRKFTSDVYAPDAMQTAAMEFLKADAKEPFFLYFATPLPHVPLQAPDRLVNFYHQRFGEEPYFNGGAGDYFPVRYPKAAYAAMVTYIDEKVGQMVDYLKRSGQYDNTIIIFTSDNGPTFNGGTASPWFRSGGPFRSERGWGKCYLHEGGIRVPFIAVWPGHIRQGSVCNLPCASYDLNATMEQIVNGRTTRSTDGISILPSLLGEKQRHTHPFLYWEFMDDEGQQAVRQGRWKALRFQVRHTLDDVALYDLATDSTEQHNVASLYPDKVRQLLKIMDTQHQTPVYPSFRVKRLDK
jgi:arylsulfatase A-like enzyme